MSTAVLPRPAVRHLVQRLRRALKARNNRRLGLGARTQALSAIGGVPVPKPDIRVLKAN